MDIKIFKGLEGVLVCETSISFIDGIAGRLSYRGIPVEVLADNSCFEETAFLLWNNSLPNQAELQELKNELLKHRKLPQEVLKVLFNLPKDLHYMDVLKTILSLFGALDWRNSKDLYETAIKITSIIPTIIAYYFRYSNDLKIIPPDNSLSHTENFYYMCFGNLNDKFIKALESCFVLHMEQGLNASTFSSMVVGSTLSDMYSCIVSALGALKGPLHGGANERVLCMLEEIGSLENVEKYVEESFRIKRKIMGFGHRIYKTYDPRAIYIKNLLEEIITDKERKEYKYFQMAKKLEEILVNNPVKKLYPNIDLYSGIFYSYLGFPKKMFTALFALPRVVGWTAHVIEYTKDNKLFRPSGKYVGPVHRNYVSIEER
jgi:citrate synthase